MTTSVKNNVMPPNFVNNLQQALMGRKNGGIDDVTSSSSQDDGLQINGDCEEDCSKPRILVTNGDGIESFGLVYLVEALVKEGLYNVYVCAPQMDKSVAGHSVTFGETVAVSSVEMNSATAYEVSGTPVDCVSLGLSGALFSWSKPTLVVSGVNKGSSCGHHMFYSGVVAGAREALIGGVPSIAISLNWNKDESSESDIKNAVALSVPIINSAVRDIENGSFPKQCALNIQIPTSPSANKGFKVTKQSSWKSTLCWQAVSAKRHPTGYMPNQPGFGIQLAQLGRDASAAGAARRVTTQKKNLEIESVGVAGKSNTDRGVKKSFRLEFLDKEHEEVDDDSDIKALENNFVSVTPFFLSPYMESDVQTLATDWITSTLVEDK
ncbi:uncharacterized protein LOC141633666 [Silene latifolia]|uniref:uncharacterized protein LOC141633666 n=1 Tax=Silene latifolia TaxID=37657 RepID=UPI003D77DD04